MAGPDPTAPKWTPLKPFETPLSASELNGIAAAVLRLVQLNVAAPLWITKSGAGVTIGMRRSAGGGFEVFAARVTGVQARPTPNQWLYGFEEMEWNRDSEAWEVKQGGRTSWLGGDNFANPAVNGCEAPNDGVAMEGVGLDLSWPPMACSEIVAIQPGVVIGMMEIPLRSGVGVTVGKPVGMGGPQIGRAHTPINTDDNPPPSQVGVQGVSYWFAVPNALKPICPDDEGQCPPGAGGAPIVAGGVREGGPGLEVIGQKVGLRVDRTLAFDARERTMGVAALAPLAVHPSIGKLGIAFEAKGDLVVGMGGYRGVRFPVGPNALVLTADSAAATGMKWAAASSAGEFEVTFLALAVEFSF